MLCIFLLLAAAAKVHAEGDRRPRGVEERKTKDCVPPWKLHSGLCLLHEPGVLTQPGAQELCKQKGGDLVWICSKLEHEIVNSLMSQLYGKWPPLVLYWVGLHRDQQRRMVWTGPRRLNSYRGAPLEGDSSDKTFASWKHDVQLEGRHTRSVLPTLCRLPQDEPLCPLPWTSVAGMCLLYSSQKVTWTTAREFCREKQPANEKADVVWILNQQEHININSFVMNLDKAGDYWVGLHRNEKGNLVWTGPKYNYYRGNYQLQNTNQKAFFGSHHSFLFVGRCSKSHLTSLCRLPTVQPSERRCPPPWVLFADMCLLYRPEEVTWKDGRRFCQQNEGDMVWIENFAQHHGVNFYMNKVQRSLLYWVGLHRNMLHGRLQWTSPRPNDYRGNSFHQTMYDYFHSSHLNTNIGGTRHTAHLQVLCRRL